VNHFPFCLLPSLRAFVPECLRAFLHPFPNPPFPDTMRGSHNALNIEDYHGGKMKAARLSKNRRRNSIIHQNRGRRTSDEARLHRDPAGSDRGRSSRSNTRSCASRPRSRASGLGMPRRSSSKNASAATSKTRSAAASSPRALPRRSKRTTCRSSASRASTTRSRSSFPESGALTYSFECRRFNPRSIFRSSRA